MKHRSRVLATIVTAALVIGLPLSPVLAGPQAGPAPQTQAPAGPPNAPPPIKNLQFYPPDTKRPELIEKMRQFSSALGVRCEHCHVEEQGGPNPRRDFATDEIPSKVTARAMLRMTKQINDDLLAKVPNRATPAVEVSCATCHHGQSRPETLAARLSKAATSGGAGASVAELKKLRERAEFGLFDVSESGVNEAASALSREGKRAEALALLQANAESYPKSVAVPTLMAEINAAMGNTDAAVEIVKKLLAADPENPRLKQMLDRFTRPH